MTVTIDNDDALEMLIDRLRFWTDDDVTIELFSDYYERMIEEGCFEGSEFNVMYIVDNDYVNYMTVYTREELEHNFDEIEEDRIMAESGDSVLYYVG